MYEFELQTILNALLLVSVSYLCAQWWRQTRFVPASARGIDPVGEAEVYLFQGKTKCAIRVLKAALQEDPCNLPVKVVLLRALADGGHTQEYSRLAAEVRVQLEHEPIWGQIKKTGRQLEPNNTLYY